MTYQPGRYPKEYNPKVHGPFYQWRYYGKPDIPLTEVKIADLGSWVSRRSFTPSAIWGAIHRGYYKWAHKNMHARSPGIAPYVQLVMCLSAYYFVQLYSDRKYHRHCKYH